jgi:hypothetical protein
MTGDFVKVRHYHSPPIKRKRFSPNHWSPIDAWSVTTKFSCGQIHNHASTACKTHLALRSTACKLSTASNRTNHDAQWIANTWNYLVNSKQPMSASCMHLLGNSAWRRVPLDDVACYILMHTQQQAPPLFLGARTSRCLEDARAIKKMQPAAMGCGQGIKSLTACTDRLSCATGGWVGIGEWPQGVLGGWMGQVVWRQRSKKTVRKRVMPRLQRPNQRPADCVALA